MFFTDDGLNYVCSGTAVLSGNKSVVWTAGHCVHDGASNFHTNWTFVPAYADGSRPYGTWTARALLTTSGWAGGGDFSYDNGAAVVSANAGSALTDVVGGRDIAFNGPRGQQYASHGYPAAAPFNGQRLWVCNSPLVHDDTSANPPTMGIDCDMTGGSSGGGWIAGGSVVLGQLVRLHDAAERDVRPLSGIGGAEPVHAGRGQLTSAMRPGVLRDDGVRPARRCRPGSRARRRSGRRAARRTSGTRTGA